MYIYIFKHTEYAENLVVSIYLFNKASWSITMFSLSGFWLAVCIFERHPRKKTYSSTLKPRIQRFCKDHQKKTSWWFQPNWKILIKTGIFSPGRGENKKYLKPPPKENGHAMQTLEKIRLNKIVLAPHETNESIDDKHEKMFPLFFCKFLS